jgi:hypothetical protein
MNRLTILCAAATAAGTVAFATGCGSTTTTVTVPSTPATGAASSSTSAPATTSASTPGAASVASCATKDLKATLGPAQAGAGSAYIALQLTNIGSAECSLYGFPGVSLAGGSPVKEISPGAERSNTVPSTQVKLAPGGVAYATLQVAEAANYPASACEPKPSTYLQIYPPGQTTPIYLAYSSTACVKSVHQLWIQAMRAGTGG